MSLKLVVGTEVYISGTAALIGGVTSGYSVNFDPKNPFSGNRWHITMGGVSLGVKRSIIAGVTLSNTKLSVGFDGVASIADYTGLVRGKSSN